METDRPVKILIFEDNEGLGRMLRVRLSASGYETLVAPDAVIGMEAAQRFKPDLVILDLMLPAGGGLKVLEGLRGSVYTAGIPVLVVSGMEQELMGGYVNQVRQMGIEGYLRKPFEAKQLLSEIQRILAGDSKDDRSGPTS